MANNDLPVGAVRAGLLTESWLAPAAYVALLLLVFVGLSPFAVRDTAALSSGQDINAGAGDLARQICYLLVFAVIAGAALQKRGLRALDAIPVSLAILLAWCLLSALWAVEPAITLRRAGLAIVVVLSAMLSVNTIGVERSLRILRIVLASVLLVNWLSIPFVAQSVHLPGEADIQLIGDWRGLYFHKNIAGAVSALTSIVFFFFAFETRRWIDVLLAIAAAAFTVMTHSIASLGLLPIALAAGGLYRFVSQRPLDRHIVVVGFAFVLALAAIGVIWEWGNIARMFANPLGLTGRVAIWQAEIAYIADHPLLGSGFGSFADTGAHSPIYPYAGSAWIGNVAHGHNGYLQLLVTIGVIGFTLAMAGLLVGPLIAFWRNGAGIEITALLFAIFVFIVLHNAVESDFLEGDGPAWVTFLLALAMLRKQDRQIES